jgi:diguanylate cyclase (GGDEF)-like protein/putative nucleotidyltransferase with HDIG domain
MVPWLLSWLPVILTLVIAGGACWAVLTLNRAADRTRAAQVTLAEIQRNIQNAESLFLRSSSLAPPPGKPGADSHAPPPIGFASGDLEANDLARLSALRSTTGHRNEISVVSRELAALNAALRPLSGSTDPTANIARGQQTARRLDTALSALAREVSSDQQRAARLSSNGTVAIMLFAALALAVMLRRFEHRRRRASEEHAVDLRMQALHDPLTTLANRRQLTQDLERAVRQASLAHPVQLMFFDLDGFKSYNDTFGHHEGDELLRRLGRALADAAAPVGEAYRLGGDEFCALISAPSVDESVEVRLQQSLASSGDGFSIRASIGSVLLPTETRDPETAMQWADARMYAQKDAGRLSAGQQSRNLALELLAAQEPEVFEHSGRVATLAEEIGRRMAMSRQALSELTRAAELHDIGKTAIPSSVLEKAGPLSDDEWTLMRRHPLIGANILSSAPALASVAAIVRSTHERFDGEGYPAGLTAEEIPLASRIVFACDSFDAMTSDRPYRTAMTEQQAIEELGRCAGTQFDPKVICRLKECLRDDNTQAARSTRTARADSSRQTTSAAAHASAPLPVH